MIYTEILVVVLLVLINAGFALSEISIVSASRPLLKHLAKQGDKNAEVALALAENPGRFLSTIQLGITLVGIVAGAYGEAKLTDHLAPYVEQIPVIGDFGRPVAVVIIVSLITYFSVTGEIIPKKFALHHAEKIALRVARPMNFLSMLMHPVVWLLESSADACMKVFGIFSEGGTSVSEEEFKAVLSDSAESGVIEKSEHEMLQRVIRLDDRDVKSIMTHRTEVVFIDVNDTLEAIRQKIHETGHSRYAVVDGGPDELKGYVQAKELLDQALSGQGINLATLIHDVMILPESASCLQALEAFKKQHISLIVIVDEYGSTQGIVTASDILEAIVGVLPSNYDKGEQLKIVERTDGSWLVDGRTPIEEIHLAIGLHEISADEDFDTIAGYVLEELRRTPREGARFEAFGHGFEIVDMDNHRIDKVLIAKLAPVDESKPA